jgi:hypothetical protein
MLEVAMASLGENDVLEIDLHVQTGDAWCLSD